jgi:hypothetical protein
MKKVLKQIAYQLEALSLSVAALEAAALSPEYGGRRLTRKQLNELKLSAQEKHKKIFDRLEAMILALPSKL